MAPLSWAKSAMFVVFSLKMTEQFLQMVGVRFVSNNPHAKGKDINLTVNLLERQIGLAGITRVYVDRRHQLWWRFRITSGNTTQPQGSHSAARKGPRNEACDQYRHRLLATNGAGVPFVCLAHDSCTYSD